MDEGAAGGVANKADIHATPTRGVQEGHACHGQDREGAIWAVVPTTADTQAKMERVYGYVYTFLARARKLSGFTPVAVRTRGTGKETVTTHGPPAEQYREAARLCLLQDAQVSIRKEGLEGLTAETWTYDVEGFTEKKIIMLGGRQKKYLRVAYDKGVLPILPARHPLSRLYLKEAHRTNHAGVDAMGMRSRSQV